MTFVPQPRKAEKRRVKLKMAVQGPSGSGKTWGALALAKNMWPAAKICVVDTEKRIGFALCRPVRVRHYPIDSAVHDGPI
jgi:hypothetical protein